jgi:hypothetical protein
VLALARSEVRPFTHKQIELASTFALHHAARRRGRVAAFGACAAPRSPLAAAVVCHATYGLTRCYRQQ